MGKEILISGICVDECKKDFDVQDNVNEDGSIEKLKVNHCFTGKITIEFITSGDFNGFNTQDIKNIIVGKLLNMTKLW